MRILDRLRAPRDPASGKVVSAYVHGGSDHLEVVGEAGYQDNLWSLCGGRRGGRVRRDVVAVLTPEPHNPYDASAIAVHVDGRAVGYLPRDVAARYVDGLWTAMARCGEYVALRGVVVGGGARDGGPGPLGVWLEHDPADFGVAPASAPMRTGFGEEWLVDAADEGYDPSWFDDLPDEDLPAIAALRALLADDPDPVDRHFQFAELEARLYRCRDVVDGALDEYDRVCRRHDAEMAIICEAFLRAWQKLPLLDTYRQMAFRRQQQKDWRSCLWWTERGLALYGDHPGPDDAVADLLRRRALALSKLEPAPRRPPRRSHRLTVTLLDQAPGATWVTASGEVEELTCTRCGATFDRLKVRGRKPALCPDCRTA